MKLYKTLIRPVVTYGAETWTLKVADENHLHVFEKKVIRRIYDPICVNGDLRIRSNKEIDKLLGHVKSLRLR